MIEREPQIDAPIPGMSLTAPLGGRPWQQPPQFQTVEEALEQYYIPKLTDKTFVPELMTIVELGIPLTTIANSFQLAAVMEGKHTIDVGMLIMPVIIELIVTIAKANDVEYVSGMSRDKEMRLSNAQIALAKKDGLLGEEEEQMEDPPMQQEMDSQQEEPPMGLMSRREEI